MTTANTLARWSLALPILLLLGGCIGSDAPSRGGWRRTIDTLPSDLGPVRSGFEFTSLPPPVVRGDTIVGVVTDDTGIEYVIRGRIEPAVAGEPRPSEDR